MTNGTNSAFLNTYNVNFSLLGSLLLSFTK